MWFEWVIYVVLLKFCVQWMSERDCLPDACGDTNTNCKQPCTCTCNAPTCTGNGAVLII